MTLTSAVKSEKEKKKRFKDTYRFSPVITDGIPLLRKGSFEYNNWWKEQRRRCLEGYTVDGVTITGLHYFYLNFWKIKAKKKGDKRKTYGPPKFTELDYDFFWAVKLARDSEKHLCVAKRRQCGFSEKAACIAAFEFMMYPSSQTIIVAGELEYSEDTMRKVHLGMNEIKNTEFYKRTTGNLHELIARFKDKGETEWQGYMSELHCMTAKNNSQCMVGKTPSLVIFEEAGKFKNLVDTFNYIKPALEAEGEVLSFALIFGTGGEMSTGADQLMKMFYNPTAYNMLEYDDIYSEEWDPMDDSRKKVGFFVPAWRYLKIDEDGNDLKEESLSMIIGKRENARLANDSKTYFNELTQFPIYTEECFLISDGNVFNSAKLNRRLAEVRRNRNLSELPKRILLDWEKLGGQIVGVKAREVGPEYEGDCFLIYEEPEVDGSGKPPQGLYKAGTDSYDRDEAVDSPSLGSIGIIKGLWKVSSTSKKFVARYTARPETSDLFYENTAKLCLYYGGALNLAEYSNIGIFKWYKNNNLEWLLRERPEIAYANVKDSKMQNRWGIDPSTKGEWISQLADYIETYCDNIDDEEMLIRLLKYRKTKGTEKYNCDITISSALCVLHLNDDFNIQVTSSEEQKKFKFTSGFKMVNGKMTRQFK